MEASPDRAPQHPRLTSVTVLLVAAAVLAAVIGVRASVADSSGSDSLDRAVREDVRRGAALVEDVRFTYSEEAPAAFQVAEARLRAANLRRAAKGKPGPVADLLRAEAAAQDQVIETLERTQPITTDPKYRKPDGSYDVPRRLADRRGKNPQLVKIDPDATEEEGLDSAKASTLFTAATIPLAVAFLFGALTEGFPARRRPLVIVGYAFLALGVIWAVVVEVAL